MMPLPFHWRYDGRKLAPCRLLTMTGARAWVAFPGDPKPHWVASERLSYAGPKAPPATYLHVRPR
jgi:hypothetical protein